jgi:serine protease
MFARKTTQILAASLALVAMGCDSDPAGLSDPPLNSFLMTSTESVLIEPGDAVTVTATKNGAAATPTWSTANAAVATVSGTGVITAVGAGATYVTATLGSEIRHVAVNVPTLQGTQIQYATPVTNLSSSAARNSIVLYRVFVPTGTTNLTVTLAGGTGDVDLLVRQGQVPTATTAPSATMCRSENAANGETCTFNSATGLTKGSWYIGLLLWDPYAGVTLTATKTP